MATATHAGEEARAGIYRCTNCGNEFELSSGEKLPSCAACGEGQWRLIDRTASAAQGRGRKTKPPEQPHPNEPTDGRYVPIDSPTGAPRHKGTGI